MPQALQLLSTQPSLVIGMMLLSVLLQVTGAAPPLAFEPPVPVAVPPPLLLEPPPVELELAPPWLLV